MDDADVAPPSLTKYNELPKPGRTTFKSWPLLHALTLLQHDLLLDRRLQVRGNEILAGAARLGVRQLWHHGNMLHCTAAVRCYRVLFLLAAAVCDCFADNRILRERSCKRCLVLSLVADWRGGAAECLAALRMV